MRYLIFLLAFSASAVDLNYEKLEKLPTPVLIRTVDKENLRLRFEFEQLQALNQYAQTRGWHPPKVAPLCIKHEIPKLPKLPEFKPTVKDGTMPHFEQEISDYVKSVVRTYAYAGQSIEDTLDAMKTDCLY